MPKISISYRRTDSDVTGRIFDRLVHQYGKNSVFRDIDNIPLGLDFRKVVNDALRNTDVLIAIVGPNWRGARKRGNVRINDENDLVRIEIETALQRDIPVIPALVGGALMPKAAELPESLRDFPFRNAATIDSGRNFDTDVARLMRSMEWVLKEKGNLEPAESTRGTEEQTTQSQALAVSTQKVANKRFRVLRERWYLRPPVLIGSLLVIVLVGVWIVSELKPNLVKTTEESSWKQAVEIGSVDGFKQYLIAFPHGAHAVQASARIAELQRQAADEDAWSTAVLKATVAAFEEYIKVWPTGAHVAEASARASALAAAFCRSRYPTARSQVPAFNTISCRQGVLVFDESCGRGKVMKIVGGCQEIGISRLTFCVSCEEGFGRLGVQTEKVTTTMAPGIKLPTPRGLMIIDLDENGAAKAAGMRTGDIILMMNGIEINQPDELAQIFAKTSPDKGIDVLINRNGTDKNFSVVLGP